MNPDEPSAADEIAAPAAAAAATDGSSSGAAAAAGTGTGSSGGRSLQPQQQLQPMLFRRTPHPATTSTASSADSNGIIGVLELAVHEFELRQPADCFFALQVRRRVPSSNT